MAETQFEFWDFLEDETDEPETSVGAYGRASVKASTQDTPRIVQDAPGTIDDDWTMDRAPSGEDRSEDRIERPAITLRYYQEEAIQGCFKEWEKGEQKTSIILPTGCGKTVTFGTLIRRYDDRYGPREDGSRRRALVLAHRDELIKQAVNSLAALGVDSAIEKAASKARADIFGDPNCVVGSVQSMQTNGRSKRLDTWPKDYFDLIVTDEGHHGGADTYQRIYDYFNPPRMLFVTATPAGMPCESLAYEYPMDRAVREGYLCPIRIRWCDTGVDLSQIRTTAGDLNQADIEEAIKPHIEKLANAAKKEIGDRKTLVFTPDVGSAEAFASALESLGLKSASLSGGSKQEERDIVLDAFRHGTVQVLCNCALFTEGFDVPDISAVVLLRPTKSRTLYCQMVGRGTRIADGKENLVVIDFPWVSGRHKLVQPTELFDSTKQSEERYTEANRILRDGETDDLMAAITKADEVIRERVKYRIKAREKKVAYGKVEYDPLAVGDILGIPQRRESESALKKLATEKQLNILRKAKVVGGEAMSSRRASQYIDKIFEIWDRHGATIPQMSLLVSKGVDPEVAREMSFDEASNMISQLKSRGWR